MHTQTHIASLTTTSRVLTLMKENETHYFTSTTFPYIIPFLISLSLSLSHSLSLSFSLLHTLSLRDTFTHTLSFTHTYTHFLSHTHIRTHTHTHTQTHTHNQTFVSFIKVCKTCPLNQDSISRIYILYQFMYFIFIPHTFFIK